MSVTKLISRAVAKRAAQGLKGPAKSATRLDESGKKVRMSKDTRSGVMREVASGKGKKQQSSPTAQQKRKVEGQQAADLNQPAAGSVGKGAEQADAGLPDFKVAAKKANVFDKDLADAKKLVKKYTEQLKKLKNPTGKDRFKGSKAYENRMEKIKSVQTLLTQAKQKVADKKSRGGPGGQSKLTTAQRKVIGKNEGGSLKNKNKKSPDFTQGLDKKFSAKVAKQNKEAIEGKKKKKYGGKISYRKGGGKVMSGNDLVASCYD